ncbi:hypothetical protein SAMN02949497_0272 [Methylomagnum ishizawai]|uniref:Uncharacterized protein n=1 Tax=Methylomagnum ishizawai TaxID=1760988 RepID=A0A1Y6DBS4_9GAMM|nr:hypothetical protein [Methylomagnum ishizawai]SMF97702.1 hypothetical protein SAMN02949497_0272 [Methylomagnum ishizawai]
MSAHAKLFGIDLRHGYYSDQRCGDFALEADADSVALLRNHRCLFKPRPDGGDIYVETGGDGKPKIAFPPDAALAFALRLDNPGLPWFTDPALPANGGDYRIDPPAGPQAGCYAKLTIRRDFNQVGGSAVVLAFAARPVLWVYYVVTDQAGEFAIASPDPALIAWQRADADDDRVAQALAVQYPGAECQRFVSERLVPCRESGLPHIRLQLGGNTVIENLPNPSWRNYFQTGIPASGGTVDAIFQIVKYLSNTTLTKV